MKKKDEKIERDGKPENETAAGEVRLMAEGRMVEWEDLVHLADGAMVQVLGNMRDGMGKKSKKKTGKNPWVSDGWGVPSWAQKSSLVEWQLD